MRLKFLIYNTFCKIILKYMRPSILVMNYDITHISTVEVKMNLNPTKIMITVLTIILALLGVIKFQ